MSANANTCMKTGRFPHSIALWQMPSWDAAPPGDSITPFPRTKMGNHQGTRNHLGRQSKWFREALQEAYSRSLPEPGSCLFAPALYSAGLRLCPKPLSGAHAMLQSQDMIDPSYLRFLPATPFSWLLCLHLTIFYCY